jgi:hypothetical protein
VPLDYLNLPDHSLITFRVLLTLSIAQAFPSSPREIIMAQAEVIPSGGYNQEARQNPSTSTGYIYSSSGDDVTAYVNDVYPYLPDYVSFGTEPSANDLTFGPPGQNSIPSTATIYPYEGDAPASLPRTLTINAGTVPLDFILIAKVLSITPVESADTGSSGDTTEWNKGEIERHTVTTLFKGGVLQELVGENGDRYALVSAFDDPDSSIKYAPTELNGLANMPLPESYTYESSILTEDLVLNCLDVAHILIYTSFNFQRYVTAA